MSLPTFKLGAFNATLLRFIRAKPSTCNQFIQRCPEHSEQRANYQIEPAQFVRKWNLHVSLLERGCKIRQEKKSVPTFEQGHRLVRFHFRSEEL